MRTAHQQSFPSLSLYLFLALLFFFSSFIWAISHLNLAFHPGHIFLSLNTPSPRLTFHPQNHSLVFIMSSSSSDAPLHRAGLRDIFNGRYDAPTGDTDDKQDDRAKVENNQGIQLILTTTCIRLEFPTNNIDL